MEDKRRPALSSRKFWCMLICAMLPWVNWATIKMPVPHIIAAMFPWMAYATGELAMDWTQVFFKSWFRLRNGLTPEGNSDPTKPSDAPEVTPTDAA